MKTVYGRIVPGLTRNAVSNRVPKIGAKTVALPDTHIAVLKRLQLPITARSHYLTVADFIKVCQYYGRCPPSNLSNFTYINSMVNPAQVLKDFNTQNPIAHPPPHPHPSLSTLSQAPPTLSHNVSGGAFYPPGSMSQPSPGLDYSSYSSTHQRLHHSVSEDSSTDLVSPKPSPHTEGTVYMYMYIHVQTFTVVHFDWLGSICTVHVQYTCTVHV